MFEQDLINSKRPGILVGGGAYKSRDAIVRFAEKYAIPVFRTWNALDVITDDSPVFGGTVGTYGGKGRNFGIQNCDLLLVLGCRLSGRITGGLPETFARGAKIYLVDVDPNLLNPEYQQRKADVNIHMDCGEFIGSINHSELRDYYNKTDWLVQCLMWAEQYDPVRPEHDDSHPYKVMRKISELLPSNAIVTYDTGGNAIMMGHCFESKRGQRIFSSNGNSPMGFSMCGAIGAWFAEPTRPVYCIIGDGGMQLNIQELQTIRHYNCNIKVIIFNNGILGNTKSWQRVNSRAELACGPDGYSAPDFHDIGFAYGIAVHRSSGDFVPYGALLPELPQNIIDIKHPDFCTYEPRMSYWDRGIEEMYPPLDPEEYKENMHVPMLDGWDKRNWR